MSALDFVFSLNNEGLIIGVTPQPHHIEPAGLRAPLGVGEAAIAFTLPDVNGNPVSFANDGAGAAATLVVFTSNHCPWALGWHDRLQRVAHDYQNCNFCMLQITSNDPLISPRDAIDKSRARVAAGDFATPLLIDTGQSVARAWGARHTPELFLIDRKGNVAYHGAPDADSEDPTLHAAWIREAVDALLAGRKPERAKTSPLGCTIKWTL